MRILALDLGEKRIGVAITDALGLTAQGLKTVQRTSDEVALTAIEAVLTEHDVTRIVVGLPLNMSGSDSQQTQAVRQFEAKLKKRFRKRAEIVYWDERLSTAGANRTLLEADLSRKRRRELIDKMSAVLILQGYLIANPVASEL